MWHMQDGHRVLAVAEWEVFKIGLSRLADAIKEDIADETNEWDTGVAVFDRLTPEQKLSLLADTASALSDPAVPAPYHTAANAGAIAAVLQTLAECLELEMMEGGSGEATIRRLLLAASEDSAEDIEGLPDLACTDLEEWKLLVECLEMKILWDHDYVMGDCFLDLPPDRSRTGMNFMGIDPEYFVAAPDEPDRKKLRAARRKLAGLL
jgi:hypothetical protein